MISILRSVSVLSPATLSPTTRLRLTSLFIFFLISFFLGIAFFSPLSLSLCRAHGSGWVVIQSQAGCSNHCLLIGFIILTQDLRWERISWPRRAAFPCTHKCVCAHMRMCARNHTQWLSSLNPYHTSRLYIIAFILCKKRKKRKLYGCDCVCAVG